ncbi:glycolipid translocation protein [Martiniozyma asiatica (nom. inval.)]|nr:glycolipid translocation protein [Martiniozyma asiatica]
MKSLIFQKIGSRVLLFGSKQWILHSFTSTSIGQSALADTLLTTMLQFARDPIRLSFPATDPQLTINWGYFSMIVYAVISPVFIYWGLSQLSTFNLLMIWISGLLELSIEPHLLITQYVQLNYGLRATIESSGLLFKTLIQIVLLKLFNFEYIDSYTISLVVYAMTLVILYNYQIKISAPTFEISRKAWQIYKSHIISEILHIFLSNGDNLIMATLPFETQGQYAFINNYGSLIVRMIFQPIEESTRIEIKHDKDYIPSFELYAHILPLIAIFGYFNINFILNKINSGIITNLTKLPFKIYTLCLPMWAINGVLEAYVVSTHGSNVYFMACNSLLYAAIILALKKYGLLGFVLANMVNCLVRILWNGSLARFNIGLSMQQWWVPVVVFVGAAQMSIGEVDSLRKFALSGLLGFLSVTVWALEEFKRYPKGKQKVL